MTDMVAPPQEVAVAGGAGRTGPAGVPGAQRERFVLVLLELLELVFDDVFELVLEEVFDDVFELVLDEVLELVFDEVFELEFDELFELDDMEGSVCASGAMSPSSTGTVVVG